MYFFICNNLFISFKGLSHGDGCIRMAKDNSCKLGLKCGLGGACSCPDPDLKYFNSSSDSCEPSELSSYYEV